MDMTILSYINNKPDYLIALRAIKGESISSDDIDGLINTYRSCLANNGITNENLIRMYMYSDIPGLDADFINEADKPYLASLIKINKNITQSNDSNIDDIDIDKLLSDELIDEYLKIALVRTILDILSIKDDIESYRDDISKLAEFITNANTDKFNQASMFLMIIRSKRR